MLVIIDIFEDGKEQGYMLYNELIIPNIDSVKDIVGVLDEEEYARTENFLACRSKYKG